MIQLLKKLFGKPTPKETRQQLLNKYYDAKKDADYSKMRDIANRLYKLKDNSKNEPFFLLALKNNIPEILKKLKEKNG